MFLVPASLGNAAVLVSNLAGATRDTTALTSSLWATQAFNTDAVSHSLTSIQAVLGNATGGHGVTAQLRLGSPSGTLLTTFSTPSLAGPLSAETLTPLSAVTLAPSTEYWLVIGVTRADTLGWSYEEGNGQVGPGTIGGYGYSTDLGATWGAFGSDNPYKIQVNVGTSAAPEPSTWLMMLAGFGGLGLAVRRTRRQKTT